MLEENDAAQEAFMAVAELKIQSTPTTQAGFRRILVATDFSKVSRRALSEALALAEGTDARVSVAHVLHSDWRYEMLDSPPEIDLERIDAEQRLKALIHEMGADGKVDATLIKHGSVSNAVISMIAESQADLLVMGTRGRGGFSKLALGSVAEELLRIAPCPVLTIGPNATVAATHAQEFHSILFATDFGKGSAKALPLALMLVKANHAKLILLHMMSPMPATSANLSSYAPATSAADELVAWEGSSRKRSLQQLKECLPLEIALDQEPAYVVGTDFLPEGILTAAHKFKVDLIVMGANQKGSARVAAHSPWTAVHEIIRSATCPVLTVAG
jgi:nucleotide-binding universal stress UspA family protein